MRMSLEENWRPWYPIVVFAFYALQGFYMTGLTVYTSVYVTDVFKLPPETVSLVYALLMSPTYLKVGIIWISDKFPVGRYGRRRPYMAISAILFAISFGILSLISSYGILWIGMIIISLLCWVLADGSLDGLTIDVTPSDKMGLMQGMAWGGRALGSALGGITAAFISGLFGWTNTVLIIGAMAILMSLSGVLIKEPKITKERLPNFVKLKAVAKKRETWLGIIYLLISWTVGALSVILGPFLLEYLKIDTITMGWCISLMNLGTFLGCIIMGKFSDIIGTRKANYIANALAVCGVLLFSFGFLHSISWLFAFAIILGILTGPQNVAQLRIMMELSPPEIGATMFAIFASISNFSAGIGLMLISLFTPLTGPFIAILLAMVPLTVLCNMILPFMKLYEPSKA
jgi:SHS family lactate transporter-like MFS transporter